MPNVRVAGSGRDQRPSRSGCAWSRFSKVSKMADKNKTEAEAGCAIHHTQISSSCQSQTEIQYICLRDQERENGQRLSPARMAFLKHLLKLVCLGLAFDCGPFKLKPETAPYKGPHPPPPQSTPAAMPTPSGRPSADPAPRAPREPRSTSVQPHSMVPPTTGIDRRVGAWSLIGDTRLDPNGRAVNTTSGMDCAQPNETQWEALKALVARLNLDWSGGDIHDIHDLPVPADTYSQIDFTVSLVREIMTDSVELPSSPRHFHRYYLLA